MSFLMKVVVGGKIPKKLLKRTFQIDPDSLLEARGFDFALHGTWVREKSIKLQFWILNAPFSDSDRSSLYYASLGLIVFFQKNHKRSFRDVPLWFNAFKKHSGRHLKSYPKECLVLIGTANNHEVITSENGSSLAHKFGMAYYETSPNPTETARIMTEIFTKMAEAYLNYVETLQSMPGANHS
ncbi:MAG: hypothetical protein ACFFDC_21200 [Promethearchaeota archaeon]